jgi:hypothetical protein
MPPTSSAQPSRGIRRLAPSNTTTMAISRPSDALPPLSKVRGLQLWGGAAPDRRPQPRYRRAELALGLHHLQARGTRLITGNTIGSGRTHGNPFNSHTSYFSSCVLESPGAGPICSRRPLAPLAEGWGGSTGSSLYSRNAGPCRSTFTLEPSLLGRPVNNGRGPLTA